MIILKVEQFIIHDLYDIFMRCKLFTPNFNYLKTLGLKEGTSVDFKQVPVSLDPVLNGKSPKEERCRS